MELTFLGTGPVGGIKDRGRSRRFESSALIKTKTANILIDVTNFFGKQAKLIDRVDAVLITHGHQDAIGGLGSFILWQIKKGGVVPILSVDETLDNIRKRHKNHLDLLDLHPIKPYQKFQLGNLIITPFLVDHSIQPGFPTLGFHFSLNGKRLVYVSDVASWNKKVEKLMKNTDVLVIDGAMWGKKMIAHLDIKEVLPKICSWSVKRIIFTQIGHTAPKHQVLQKEIKKICPKALPAYDGMRLKT